MTLKKGIVASQRSMRQQKIRFQGKLNPVEAKLAKNALFKRAVNKPAEWREIHGMIKEIAEGGVYKDEMRELSDKLAHGNKAKTLDHKEGRLIAEAIHEEFCPELKKYKSSWHNSSKSAGYKTFKSSSKNASYKTTRPNPESKNTAAPANNTRMTPERIAYIMNKARKNSMGLLKNKDEGPPRGDFSRALDATMKNKRG